jgi:hypothetical protein
VLTSHHVQEINEGGPDVPENIWVLCSSCHRLVHHQRTYLNEHVKSHISEGELIACADKEGLSPANKDMLVRLFRLHEARHGRE